MFVADAQLFATGCATGDAQRMCARVFKLDEVWPRIPSGGIPSREILAAEVLSQKGC
ncbi:hypothetical protein Pyn_22685 [Prunus yedoensis var. nudiflora]|uniref:Uncharacterized protein n=1 Tax=Prunus yedoensis var. nudiflora TaxID=2094558 RepID=A0A314UFN5_PRUYE|nr:hypothetical protein Pyn_22685 [Prunus yedoensis var. nudiflora]